MTESERYLSKALAEFDQIKESDKRIIRRIIELRYSRAEITERDYESLFEDMPQV
jgi:hypothetical protein